MVSGENDRRRMILAAAVTISTRMATCAFGRYAPKKTRGFPQILMPAQMGRGLEKMPLKMLSPK
jgi:hypothetical protein